MSFTIKQKILIGYGIAILISITVSIISILSLRSSQMTICDIVSRKVTYLRLVEECKINVLMLRRFEKDYLLNIGNQAEQDKYSDKLKAAMESSSKTLDSLSQVATQLALTSTVDSQISLSKQCLAQYIKDLEYVINYLKGNDVITPQEANKMVTNYKANIHAFENATDSLKNNGIFLLEKTRIEKNRNSRKTFATLVTIIVFSIVITILLGLFIAARIYKPIKSVTAMLKDISEGEGDLTKRLEITSKDEIGGLSSYFNKFVEKLQSIITSITSNTNTVASAAIELSSVSTQIAVHAEEMSTQTSTVASATEQATTNITSISSAAEEMTSSANSVAVTIEEMSASLNEVAKNCQKELKIAADADTHAKNSKNIMDKLDAAAKSIGKVVEVINDIADQTNLLALNATIEAASAGDAGKGFSVVANEVKELSKQTAQATQEIQKQVEDIQTNTELAVKAIESVSKVIEEVNVISQTIVSAVEEQSTTINEISKNVSGVSTGALEVSKNVTESATGLSEISQTIAGVNNSVADTTKSIVQVKTSAVELSKLSEDLKELLGQFKI